MQETRLNQKRTCAFASEQELLEFVKDQKTILIAMNTEKILNDDPRLREIINRNIAYPDGIGAILGLRRKGIRAIKIRGAALWLSLVRACHREKTFYLLGATDEIIRQTVLKLKAEFPSIRIIGFRNGYFAPEEYAAIKEEIVRRRPDCVLAALGSPRQEYVMADLLREHPALYMGVGGSFDLYCGKTKTVPDWWCRWFGWEGLYRAFDDWGNRQRWKRQLPATRILYRILLGRL